MNPLHLLWIIPSVIAYSAIGAWVSRKTKRANLMEYVMIFLGWPIVVIIAGFFAIDD